VEKSQLAAGWGDFVADEPEAPDDDESLEDEVEEVVVEVEVDESLDEALEDDAPDVSLARLSVR
jgi:hypothetical protein